MATNKKKLLITESMAPGGWALFSGAGDIEAIKFPDMISAPDFEAPQTACAGQRRGLGVQLRFGEKNRPPVKCALPHA